MRFETSLAHEGLEVGSFSIVRAGDEKVRFKRTLPCQGEGLNQNVGAFDGVQAAEKKDKRYVNLCKQIKNVISTNNYIQYGKYIETSARNLGWFDLLIEYDNDNLVHYAKDFIWQV